MGFSVAASSAIIFIGFLFVAGLLFTSVSLTIDELKEGLDNYSNKIDKVGNSQITIDNATNTTVMLYINATNTGSETLKVSQLEILLNGTLVTGSIINSSVDGDNKTDLWSPEETLFLEISHPARKGERVVMTTGDVKDYKIVT